MSEEAERWKEKYLKGIEQQDRLEKRWQARLDLLRRGLVRSSLAAEGSDRAVDECMKEMREIVRKDDMDAGLAGLIPRLEKAVLDSEHRREVRVGQISTALGALVAQLQALPLPREVRKPLKRLAKGLEERASQARELPLLLSELSALQGKALSAQEKTAEDTHRPSLFERLFGSHEPAPGEPVADAGVPPAVVAGHADVDSAPPQPVEDTASLTLVEAPAVSEAQPPAGGHVVPETAPVPESTGETPAVAEASPVAAPLSAPVPPSETIDEPAAAIPLPSDEAAEPQVPEPPQALPEQAGQMPPVEDDADRSSGEEPEPELEPGPEQQAQTEQEPDEEHSGEFALPASPEPSYSAVAAHIEEILLGLLNDLELPEHQRPQADSMRQRLEHGLNWYELLPILEDLSVLMLAISDSGQHEFEAYLKQLNQRLEYFQSSLQVVSDDHATSHSSARHFDSQLREHVDDLQISVQDASDLDSLKRVLESRLEGLLGAMDEHQRQRDAREHEVAERLQNLANRVASMEQEALGFRANLEEQRRKALIDPLTGLPNRAAWNERLEREVAQAQQGGPGLLLCIMDLDHFKRINDTYGHLAGDKVLKIVAKELHKRQRSKDFLARFGGEEFVLLLPATAVDTGLHLLDELRATVERCPFHFKGEPVTITVSMGVTALRTGERSDVALKRADQALYRAKENGRNRVEQG